MESGLNEVIRMSRSTFSSAKQHWVVCLKLRFNHRHNWPQRSSSPSLSLLNLFLVRYSSSHRHPSSISVIYRVKVKVKGNRENDNPPFKKNNLFVPRVDNSISVVATNLGVFWGTYFFAVFVVLNTAWRPWRVIFYLLTEAKKHQKIVTIRWADHVIYFFRQVAVGNLMRNPMVSFTPWPKTRNVLRQILPWL